MEAKIQQMETKDYAIWGSMVAWTIALVYTGMFKSAESFLKVDMLMNIIHGISWVIMPVAMIQTLEIGVAVDPSKLDGGHVYFAYMCGFLMLYTAAIVWVCVSAEENTALTNVLWSKLVMSVIFLVAETYNHMKYRKSLGSPDKWLKMDITYTMCAMMIIAWISCGVSQLRRFEHWGGYPEHMNRLNFHVRLDYIISLVLGLGFLSFPDWGFKSTTLFNHTDPIHTYLSRCAGIMLIHSAILTGNAPSFLQEMPKVRLLFCRMVLVVLLSSTYFAVMHYHNLLLTSDILWTAAPKVIWGGNALSGFLFSRFGQLK